MKLRDKLVRIKERIKTKLYKLINNIYIIILLVTIIIIMIFIIFKSEINQYSALVQARATVVLVLVTIANIYELRAERRFRLKLEHWNKLKKRVIEPWINELKKING